MLYATVYNEEQSYYFLLKILCFIVIIGCLTVLLSLKWKLRHLLIFNIFLAGACEVAFLIFSQAGVSKSKQ